jgi:MATE family multidrug resistance protein
VKLSLIWGFGFGLGATLLFLAAGAQFIDLMTANEAVRLKAREFLGFAALASVTGTFAFTFDGIYIGATWTRAMRDLMLATLAVYLAVWWLTKPLGNAGLWLAILTFLASRGMLQALRYPALARQSFARGWMNAG